MAKEPNKLIATNLCFCQLPNLCFMLIFWRYFVRYFEKTLLGMNYSVGLYDEVYFTLKINNKIHL